MDKVKKAIIMAAGTGTRLKPLTSETPKPLIKVNNKVLIEGIIEAIIARGIDDIIIVVGYLCEQFEYLKEKYKIKIIYNKDYKISNNISSLYYAKNELDSCIILDGDQIISDPKIVKKRFKHSGYSCWYTVAHSDEWMLKLDSQLKIVDCERDGGAKGWELKSLSYWSHDDAIKLAGLVKSEYENGNTQIYWDDVAMFVHNDKFDLYGHKIRKNSLIEIDSLDELIQIDKSYKYLKEKD